MPAVALVGRAGEMRSKRKSGNGRSSLTGTHARLSMTGNKRKGIILQERDRHLLRELGVMRVIDRMLAMAVAGFGSITRANNRLLALVRVGLLLRFFMGTDAVGKKALYTLSP